MICRQEAFLLKFYYIYTMYSRFMRTFSWSFYCFLTHIQSSFQQLWCHDFKNNSSNDIPKLCKAPNQLILFRKIKIISCTCNVFTKRFPALHLNIFALNVFNKRNLPETQDKKSFYVLFLITRRRVFLQQNAVRLLNKTVSEI